MKTTIVVNGALLEEARKIGGHRNKGQAADAALQAYITQRKQTTERKQFAILDLFGQIDYGPDAPALKPGRR